MAAPPRPVEGYRRGQAAVRRFTDTDATALYEAGSSDAASSRTGLPKSSWPPYAATGGERMANRTLQQRADGDAQQPPRT